MASRPFGGRSGNAANYGTVSTDGAYGFNQEDSRSSETLVRMIKDGVIFINQNTQKLKSFERQVGTSSDNNEFRNQIQSLIKSTLRKVNTSKQQLGDFMQIARRSEDKGQQSTANSMQQTLTSAIKDFQNMFQRVQNKLEQHRQPPRRAGEGYLDSGELEISGDRAQLITSAPTQQLIVTSEVENLEERAARLSELESDINVLCGIMREIGQMADVQEQVTTINYIEVKPSEAIVSTVPNPKNRVVNTRRCSWRMMCIISTIVGVIVVTLLIVIIVVVAVVTKTN